MEKINIRKAVTELDFGMFSDTKKIHESLKKYGVMNISFLCRCSEELIARLTGFSHPTMNLIKAGLATYGLRLNMSIEDLESYEQLPDDYFIPEKDVTLSEVEKLRSEYTELCIKKDALNEEMLLFQEKQQKARDEEWNSFVNHLDIYEEFKQERDNISSLAERLENVTSRLEMVGDHSIYHIENEFKPVAHHPMIDVVSILHDKELVKEFENEKENIVNVTDEEQSTENVIENTVNYVDLLSKDAFSSLLDESDSSVYKHLFKRMIDKFSYNPISTLFDLCQKSSAQVTKDFDGIEEITSVIKTELLKHDLTLDMSVYALNKYQKLYEKYVKSTTHVETEEEHMDSVKKELDNIVNQIPLTSVRCDDLEYMRMRLIEKAYLSQPWYIRYFRSNAARGTLAIKQGEEIFNMYIKRLADISMNKEMKSWKEKSSKDGRK